MCIFARKLSVTDDKIHQSIRRLKYDAALKAYRGTYAVMEGQYEEGMKKMYGERAAICRFTDESSWHC